MKRAFLIVAMTMVALLLSSGVALAAALTGTEGPDVIEGTTDDDTMDAFNEPAFPTPTVRT
jgi:hypothetical protein